MKKQPEKTLRTRNKIIEAFWELYREKPIEKISINAIMQAAGMNRGTFYEYFVDIYALLDTVEDELLKSVMLEIEKFLRQEMKKQGKAPMDFNVKDFTQALVKVLPMYGDKTYILLGRRGGITFQNKFKEKLRGYLALAMPPAVEEENVEYILTFMVSAISSMVSLRYEIHGQTEFPDFVALVVTLVEKGVLGYMDEVSK